MTSLISAFFYSEARRKEFDIHRTVHRDIFLNKSQRDALFLKFILVKNSTYCGQTYCPSSLLSTLYTVPSRPR